MSFEVIRNAQSQELELRSALRKCLHVYHYWKHPQLGFLYARLQTWFPFSVQIGLNGREWLARTMDQQGMKYQKQDNCFTWIEDYARAQKWMDEQLQADWPQLPLPINSILCTSRFFPIFLCSTTGRSIKVNGPWICAWIQTNCAAFIPNSCVWA